MVHGRAAGSEVRAILPVFLSAWLPCSAFSAEAAIRESVVWDAATTTVSEPATTTVSEPVRIGYGGSLTISPGTLVRFTATGRIDCEGGSLRATGASFRAGERIEGHPRLRFGSARSAVFEDCTFEGLTAVDSSKHHECSIYCIYTPLILRRCTLTNCMTVAVFHTTAPEIAMNRFVRPADHALLVSHTDRARVSGNSFEAGEGAFSGLYLKAATNCVVSENRFFGNGEGVGAYLRYGARGNALLANTFSGCRTGVVLQDACEANTMVGNLVFRPRLFGFRIRESGPGNTVANCVVWGAGHAGLHVERMRAPATVRNCVFACGERGLTLSGDVLPELSHNCFWKNRRAPSEPAGVVMDAGSCLAVDPLFVDPERGNFRLRTKAFGHPLDSPLLGAGCPDGVSVGLYP